MRELSRDGQAYFIHNRVEIDLSKSQKSKSYCLQANIVVGHGQMHADEIDPVFHAFKSGQADILIATTIVENGIDIPNANTILIDRADTYGLADLYQMRGRVGRWNRPAYAYFLVPKSANSARSRPQKAQSARRSLRLWRGMKIAMRDLEIRGAGDILGVEQSGQISSIGFHLYCKLLKARHRCSQKKTRPSFNETKMEFPYDAASPELYQ